MMRTLLSIAVVSAAVAACAARTIPVSGHVEPACGPADGAAFEIVLPLGKRAIYLFGEGKPEHSVEQLQLGAGGSTDIAFCLPGRRDCTRTKSGYFTISGSRHGGFRGNVSTRLTNGEAFDLSFETVWRERENPVICG